jgi:SAM-dependent methyltransferase
MPENIFNKRVADNYDHADRAMFDEKLLQQTSSFLSELADDRRALEFAIGTGRVALALQNHGVDVQGVELSQHMVDKLKEKPGSDKIDVVIGDMASVKIPGKFTLVYLVYNTITNLITQNEQVNCFRNAASHLCKGGFFVLEDQIPLVQNLPPGTTISAFDASDEHVGIDVIDIVNQTVISNHYWIDDGSVELFRSTHRFAWPAEYDLMAQIAGMELYGRWGGWDKSEFTSDSESHISVWRKVY